MGLEGILPFTLIWGGGQVTLRKFKETGCGEEPLGE